MRNGPSMYTHTPEAQQPAAAAPVKLTCKVQVEGAGTVNAASPESSESASDNGQRIVVNLTIDGNAIAGAQAAPAQPAGQVAYPQYPQMAPTAVPPMYGAPRPSDTAPLPPLFLPAPVGGFQAPYPSASRANLADSLPPVFPDGGFAAPAPPAQPPAPNPPESAPADSEDDFFNARHSMIDGLMEADREHSRRLNRLRTSLIVIAAILVLLLCAIALIGLAVERGLLELPAQLTTNEQQAEGEGGQPSVELSSSTNAQGNATGTTKPSSSVPQSGIAQNGGSADSESKQESGDQQSRTQSGSVRYTYTTTASEGGRAQVIETVTFDRQGLAETSSMRMTFVDEATAKAFMERIERSYGTTYLGGSRTGSTVEVRIDVSESHLDREAYKQKLSETVQGLSATEVSQGQSQSTAGSGGTQKQSASATDVSKGQSAQSKPTSGNTLNG